MVVFAEFDPAHDSFYDCRRVEEYIGYTWDHLPGWNNEPDLPKKPDAKFASFAARIARSSLVIRSRLRYGVSAFNNVR